MFKPLEKRGTQLFFLAMGVWIVLLAVLLVRAYLQPTRNTVYPIFANAAREWQAGIDVYKWSESRNSLDSFRYPPVVAIAIWPLAALPDATGGVLWRVLNASVYLGGMIALVRALFAGQARLTAGAAGCLALLLLPLSIGSLNNGQPNAMVVGCLMLGAAAALRKRWNLAAFCLAVPVCIKIYPLAAVLLFPLVQPRLGWRIAVVLTLACLAPFLLTDATFTANAYETWVRELARDNRSHFPPQYSYRDFHLLTRLAGFPLDKTSYTVLQLAMAALVAAVVFRGHWHGWTRTRQFRTAFDLGCAWMVMFGPATENCTYILLAPTLALAVWDEFQGGWPWWRRCWAVAPLAIFVASTLITATTLGRSVSYILMPSGGLLVFVERLASHVRPPRRPAAEVVGAPPWRKAA